MAYLFAVDDPQTRARRALRELAAQRRQAAEAEAEAIVAALRAGVRQVDIARDLDRSREHIRQVARARGIGDPRARP